MKYKIFLFFLILPIALFSQEGNKDTLLINESRFDISASMGLKIITVKDLVDYINYYIPYNQDEFKSVTTSPEFMINAEYRFDENYGLKLEYNYILKSYNLENTKDLLLYNISINYNYHSTSLLFDYIIRDPGYLLKFGIGPSFYYSLLYQKTPLSKNEEEFHTSGLGLKTDIYGHTQFGKNVYMLIGLNFQVGWLGDLKNKNGDYLSPKQKVSMSFISAGVNLGMVFYF